MPHQCLKCGKVFEEGSSQILKGCPDCQGNRFFFTKQPLTEDERKKISSEIADDITTKLTELIGEEHKDVLGKSGKWVTVKPKEIRRLLEKRYQAGKPGAARSADLPLVFDEEYRQKRLAQILEEQNRKESPETIHIETPGSYKIDVKGLLDQEPIIVNKDGSYTIHLPSIFKMINKDKNDE